MRKIYELAVPSRTNGSSFREEELAVTTGWAHAGKDGATMLGKGKLIVRDYPELELESIRQGVELLTLSLGKALECLGSRTVDVFLNDVAYWRNIPERTSGNSQSAATR